AHTVGGAITLSSAELLINKNLTINGPSANLGTNLLTVQRSTASGTPLFRIFDIAGNVNVTISSLGSANGQPGTFVARIVVQSGARLKLTASTLSGNMSTDSGGGIANN